MELKKFKVTIVEHLTYEIEVEAADEVKAEQLAYESQKFCSNLCDANDSEAVNIEEIEELTVEQD